MDEWKSFDPAAMRKILYDTSMLSLYVDAVQSATKPTIPANHIVNDKWLKARDMYAQGYSLANIARKTKVVRSTVQLWQDSDSVDWNILRLKYQQLSAAHSMYSHVQSQLESGSRIKAMVDEILDESVMLPFKSKGEAIKMALELDDRRRLIEGVKTSKDVVVTLTSLIKAQQIVNAEHQVVDEDKPEDLK